MIGIGFGTLPIKRHDYTPQASNITLVRARFNSLESFLSDGDFDVVVDMCVEFLYLWVRRRRGAEGVSFNNE